MKKILLLLAITVIAISCKNNGEYTITGTVKGMKIGNVYLEKQSEMGMGNIPVDTVKIVDGKFEIKGKAFEPSFHFIKIENVQGNVPFVLEGGDINITVDKDSIFKSKISGTYSNDEFYNFRSKLIVLQKDLQKKMKTFRDENDAKMNEAEKNNDTVVINSLRKQFKDLRKEGDDFMINYPKTHPKSFISILLIEGLLSNPDYKVAEVEKIFNSLDESLKKTHAAKKTLEAINNVKKQESAAKMAPTEPAPNFEAKNPEGKTISLKESLGKVTVIDFWASWCKPCRQENPNVVAMYNELHPKGLNIIGVSLDDNLDKWKEAIAKDNITWNQVSNLQGWKDPIAVQYNITQIPATIILDANGNIVAKDLRGEQLKAKVNELLAKN
ncbi:TlpA disulfide reductase family protein [Flavobacterium capsici]|uniref:TlpA disulfide reductase family protein n=1 Tax=Flavobacterium capsici TaxID=3075618 RepID=A0AA96J6Y5_9FLAO|nr:MULTISPECIES: TlpA disulfide reductase family protein [unclassified Flavobacterium]WNM17759.1 TlpA disulfide reductase family protein [Flavobacterium sp. PMR2A8]WNM21812.1 TlpA disulfide reductase family protein [Flavobacterium sp. PMTSA4]